MALEFIILLKLKLLALGGAAHCHIHAALLWFFLLKLPLAVCMRGSYADMLISARLFVFRLNRVLFPDAMAVPYGRRRWERAVRLIRERVATDGQLSDDARNNHQDSMHAVSMLAL